MLIPEKCIKCDLDSVERLKKCEICGNEYETYAIILDCNPLSIASFIEEETKEDGTIRHICETCRKKEKKKHG